MESHNPCSPAGKRLVASWASGHADLPSPSPHILCTLSRRPLRSGVGCTLLACLTEVLPVSQDTPQDGSATAFSPAQAQARSLQGQPQLLFQRPCPHPEKLNLRIMLERGVAVAEALSS